MIWLGYPLIRFLTHEARSTKTALRSMRLGKAILHWMQTRTGTSQALHGYYSFVVYCRD
jgi:hypothetical protein